MNLIPRLNALKDALLIAERDRDSLRDLAERMPQWSGAQSGIALAEQRCAALCSQIDRIEARIVAAAAA